MAESFQNSISNAKTFNWVEAIAKVAAITFNCGVAYFAAYYLIPKMVTRILDVSSGDSEASKKELSKRLNRTDLENFVPNRYESIILQDVYPFKSTDISFKDVGGLENQIEKIKESIIVPFKMWKSFKSKGIKLQYPSGMLLYGRPGTGKTLCVQALANETDATLISIKASTLMDKYYGESQKLVTALFSLARKLAPTIIFVDEIDTLLKKRGSSNGAEGSAGHDALQGAFLAEWDGLKQAESGIIHTADKVGKHSSNAPIIVVGATNRPSDLDKAILRRMPINIKMPMPDSDAREDILVKLLRHEVLASDVNMDAIVAFTEGYSGSDMKELIRVALLQRNKEVVDKMLGMEQEVEISDAQYTSMEKTLARPLTNRDFELAMAYSTPTVDVALDYESELHATEYQEKIKMVKRFKEMINPIIQDPDVPDVE